MSVNSREELKKYALRELGAPVVIINVDDSQLEDRLDQAIEYFREYHYDGIEKVYLKHQITTDDVTNKYIPVSDLVYGITRIIPIVTGSSSKNLFNNQYQLRLHELFDLSSASLIYYNTVMEHVQTLDHILNGIQIIDFNRYKNKLEIHLDWEHDVTVGDYIIIECYRALDPEVLTRVYSNQMLKKYVVALFKKQWGTNLSKYQGIQLPGGVTIDGQSMYNDADAEIKDIEADMKDKSAPLNWFIG